MLSDSSLVSLSVLSSFHDLLVRLLPPQTHFAYSLTLPMRNPVACSLLCVVSCVHVHFSNIPSLHLLSLPPCPPAGKPFFSVHGDGHKGAAEPGGTWADPAEQPFSWPLGFSFYPGNTLFLGCLSSSRCKLILLLPSLILLL